MLGSGKISPSRANYWYRILGKCRVRGLAGVQKLSRVMSSVEVWLLECDYCLVGPQSCIYWTGFVSHWLLHKQGLSLIGWLLKHVQ